MRRDGETGDDCSEENDDGSATCNDDQNAPAALGDGWEATAPRGGLGRASAKNLEREIGRAAALHELGDLMPVDLARERLGDHA